LATLLLSAHSQNLGVIFCGAAAALISTSFIGVWAGAWVARVIPPPLDQNLGRRGVPPDRPISALGIPAHSWLSRGLQDGSGKACYD
jgi:hypothetical protein